MKLELQVVSLPLAQRLKELGVKQESIFEWCIAEGGKEVDYFRAYKEDAYYCEQDMCGWNHAYVSAFTVAEIGNLIIDVDSDVIQVTYNFVFNVEGSHFITTTGLQILLTEPDLCAKMLIYLLENNLITL